MDKVITLTMGGQAKDPDSELIDKHWTVKCPHCGATSGLSAISVPRYDLAFRYRPPKLGVGYQCDACQQPVFLRFKAAYDLGNQRFLLVGDFEEVERPKESYEFNYLPDRVAEDFREALECYSNSCFNAFAAMCRRTIQSACSELGTEGTTKVLKQVEDLKGTAEIDEETFPVLKEIVIAGHDGAHPHLPPLSRHRAEILLELMKDVLYQLFVRKRKIEEAAAKRKQAISQKQENLQDT